MCDSQAQRCDFGHDRSLVRSDFRSSVRCVDGLPLGYTTTLPALSFVRRNVIAISLVFIPNLATMSSN